MKLEIKQTADGSHTLYVRQLDETYHSSHGAIQEAEHVFILNGLKWVEPNQQLIRILEMGLGTGLNAWLTAVYTQIPSEYTGIEAFPVESEILASLNYTDNATEIQRELFRRISEATWNEPVKISDNFRLHKMQTSLENAILPLEHFDLVYYDAFGPKVQSELWEVEPLRKVINSLRTGGTFVTYCAQGQFKRNLKALGMELEALPGPPGKREMTRATKC